MDQQARMNLRLVPQHGGTVAGVRLSALREIGGWNDNSLTEDTDLTYRLLLARLEDCLSEPFRMLRRSA